jgi:hypothetical protein
VRPFYAILSLLFLIAAGRPKTFGDYDIDIKVTTHKATGEQGQANVSS